MGTYHLYLDPSSVPSGFVLTGGTEFTSVTLTAGQNDLAHDYGFQQQDAQIGDLVWKDYDGDGVYDGGEPGIENVTVALYQDTNQSGTLDGGDLNLGSDTTDANGSYLFDLLPTGDYLVMVTDTNNILTPFRLTAGPNPQVLALAAGQAALAHDFGYQRTDSSIGNLIWHDLDADGTPDGTEPGFENVTVDLVDDLNENGLLDGGEPVLDSDTTDANGAYLFEGTPGRPLPRGGHGHQ